MGQEHIFIDGQVIDQVQLLMDEADARVQGIHRGGKALHLAVQTDAAAVRRENAAQNVHQGGLAGAVFSQQRAYLAGRQLEVHVLKYIVGPEGLVDFFH